jgi:hypothetical protein
MVYLFDLPALSMRRKPCPANLVPDPHAIQDLSDLTLKENAGGEESFKRPPTCRTRADGAIQDTGFQHGSAAESKRTGYAPRAVEFGEPIHRKTHESELYQLYDGAFRLR